MTVPHLMLALALGLAGCSSQPASLVYRPESALVAYETARGHERQYRAQPVRWSGLIVETRVLASGSEVEVVYLPLGRNGLPIQQEHSPGRFIARFPGLLEPALYAPGRSLSVLGSLQGTRNGQIGQQPYLFPLVDVSRHILWPRVKDVEIRYQPDPFCDDLLMPFSHRP